MSDASHRENNDNRLVESAIGVIIIVASFLYINEVLMAKHLVDVWIAVLAFGIGIVILHRHIK